ncbi:MAG TPA: Clp protease N-terminal domain-containing protein [Acidimicrobiales bacterium]|nr:Clp protease N-terminal domain-containing protein [Acidimicrobiales bacterium]
MFERFTRDARDAIITAHSEARCLASSCIGPEHILLGVASVESPARAVLNEAGACYPSVRRVVQQRHDAPARISDDDAEALAGIGIDLEEVRRATEEVFGPGALDRPAPKLGRGSGAPPFSPSSKEVLELALREAIHRKQRMITPGHLALGLCGDHTEPVEILRQLDIDIEDLRSAIERTLVT